MTAKEMHKVKNLLDLSDEEKRKFLNSFDIMMTDCDGVLWNLFEPIPGTGEALNDIEGFGKKLIYVSNNSVRPDSSYEKKIKDIGATYKPENLVHPIHTIIYYLKKINCQSLIYFIGTSFTTDLLRQAGFNVICGPNDKVEEDFHKLVTLVQDNEPVKYVIMDVDMNFSYPQFLRAELYLRDPECQLILGATDYRLPMYAGFDLSGPGYFMDALRAVMPPGKEPLILGKPGTGLGDILKEKYGVSDPQRVLFVGDMPHPDIKLAYNNGFRSLLVLSGGTSREQMLSNEDSTVIPDFYADSITALSTLIRNLPPQSSL
uniref:Putative pyridoxal phosphate phosphatase n=1 Tax=Nyssomyia neivai TaxID=330878 RepID=A0A1L8DZF4_9DIPT